MDAIKLKKGLHRNIFNIQITPEEIYNLIVYVLASSAFYDVLKQFICAAYIIPIYVALYIGIFLCRKRLEHIKIIMPYEISNTFVGLYCIEEAKAIEANFDNGLINREREVKYIDEILHTIWNQTGHKRAICLVGASGCGKSTIINLLEYGKYVNADEKYDIYNFSEKYDYLESYLKETFGLDYVSNIQARARNIVIIFDQFERYFFLNEDKKLMIKRCAEELSLSNVAIIFSIREDYFLQFLFTFDINYMDEENQTEPDYNGTIAHKAYFLGKNEGMSNDNNILVCLGEENYSGSDHNEMLRLCEQAFSEEKGGIIYDYFKNATLIQQQIIFNILENEIAHIASERFWKWDVNSMMKRYFDVQLCSTGDFFNASRIMYLLSMGRNDGIVFTNEDLEAGLCIFTQNEKNCFENCLEKLQKLHLIKKIKHNNAKIHEVSHDYIAKSFEIYASTEMPSNVKTALDEFKSEYVRKLGIIEKIEKYTEKPKKATVATGIMLLSVIVSVALYVLAANGMHKPIPVIVPVISLIALLYVYEFYKNITLHYHNGKSLFMCLCYIVTMTFGNFAVVFTDFWLVCLGIGIIVQGIANFRIGCDKKLSSIGQQMFLGYGLKTSFMVFLIVACRMFFYCQLPAADIEMVEAIVIVGLLLYSYTAHMNKEFFYAHLEMLFSSDV